MKSIHIDRGKRLKDEPHTGHNRWHPDIPHILEVEPGDEVVLGTRDARDGKSSRVQRWPISNIRTKSLVITTSRLWARDRSLYKNTERGRCAMNVSRAETNREL